ncbi:hypothetical protein GQX73_g2992 [Xylaria multiplex]|uniref:Subtelomeric hrmA-associated cluster protein AFUB-079030/YDR124W-like helical bundle domain-containing protein n=1 Tax=Xylaria multiplex TaxID=323545 RepID=A0A7C8MUC5_9PEZI|nr:hypothetical protein GQX73_g2992 [Xylaria multiplex]
MGTEYYSDDGRPTESSEARGPPWVFISVPTLIPGTDKENRQSAEVCENFVRYRETRFFVAAEENGRVICFSTPVGSSQLDHQRFFDRMGFLNEVHRLQQGNSPSFNESELGFSSGMNTPVPEARARAHGRQHYPSATVESYADDGSRKSKKRLRAGSKQPGIASRQDSVAIVTMQQPKRGIRIGESDSVYGFYDHNLKCCQQTACKIIAKAWVKAVAPKKQSTHPYTRGDESRPDWWPRTYCKFGEDTYKDLRHKEPDHLGKDERVYLLCHILRMLVEPPHKQHPSIRKANLNLSILEAVTFEALSSFFNDKESRQNASKKPLLKEIFKIARQEARYKDGEINGNTEVFVTSVTNSDAGKDAGSDSEDDGGPDQKFTPASSSASSVEPNGPQIMMPQVQSGEHGETGHFPSHGFPDNVPIRSAHYSHPGFEPELSERPSYVEAPSMGNQAPGYSHSHLGLPEMYPSPQGTSRRSSVFNSPSEYGSPATPVAYSAWPTSNTPSNPSLYGFPPQPPTVQGFGGQISQAPQYAAPSIDGLPRQTTDANHGDIFAPRTVGQCVIPHQPSYPNYVTDGASLVGPSVKTEGGHHPSITQ